MVEARPEGYPSVIPSLVVEDAGKLIDFIVEAFGATERLRMPMPDGKIAHAELELGDSVIMIGEASPQWPAGQGTLMLYVDDADATYNKALAAGATSNMEPADQFYGDRSAAVVDAWGNRWTVSTHIEDVSEEEMERRMAEMMP